MKDSDKRQLEGLLQARSEDMRHGRRPRGRQSVATQAFVAPVQAAIAPGETSQVRCCETCGEQIGTHRLRVVPSATLCLECRRAIERAESPS